MSPMGFEPMGISTLFKVKTPLRQPYCSNSSNYLEVIGFSCIYMGIWELLSRAERHRIVLLSVS